MLQIDSVSFVGVASQPALMNGDFELWQSTTLYSPMDWYVESSDGEGVNQTADAAAGNYAIELTTYEGDNNGIPRARYGSISTGYWDNSCSCTKGGYPFSNQIDTLAFSYKYSPANAGDSANVNMQFLTNGVITDYITMYYPASASYQYVELPFSLGAVPDTVIITITSSDWTDTLLASVGDNLIIDEIHFKSQPLTTGISKFKTDNYIMIYPNPCKDVFTLSMKNISSPVERITIYDVTGRMIESRKYETEAKRFSEKFDVSKFPSGAYFIQIKMKNETIQRKLFKVE